MTYTFILAHPNRESAAITAIIRDRGKKLSVSTGIIIQRSEWDAKNSKVARSAEDYKEKQMQLLQFENKLKEIIRIAEHEDSPMSKLKEILTGKKVTTKKKVAAGEYIPFLDFYLFWANNRINNHNPTRQHKQSYNLIKEFARGKSLEYEDINYIFYTSFVEWCRSVKGYKENTTGTHIRNIKAVMSEAAKRGYHKNTEYTRFQKPKEDIDSVYLTTEELDKLWNFPLTGMQAAVRDMFMLGAYTAMRFSDYSALTLWDINGDYISKRTQKTQAIVTIPMHPRVKDVLTRYNGSPKINISAFNQHIKTICMAAGIRDKVAVTSNRITKYKEKWELVSSHTARRTGATNMFLAGIPVLSIMKITGHLSERVFLKYIKVSNLENAKLIADNPFFKDNKK